MPDATLVRADADHDAAVAAIESVGDAEPGTAEHDRLRGEQPAA
jgi:hypothetical protein